MAISKVPVVPGTKTLARGSVVIGNASGEPSALAIGSNTYVLKSDGTDISWGADAGGAALTGSTNNTVVTVTGANAIQGEANLTFDGSTATLKAGSSGASASQYANQLVVESSATEQGISILSPANGQGQIFFGDPDSNALAKIIYSHANNKMRFRVNDLYALQIDSAGRILANTASPIDNNAAFSIKELANYPLATKVDATGNTQQIGFNNGNGHIGGITTNGTSTAFNTSSDYRLKENISYDFDATTRLKQLKPSRFNFKTDASKTVDGFLAHEVSNIIPEAITGSKDATETKQNVVLNANGTMIYNGVLEQDYIDGKADGNYPSDSTWIAEKEVPVYQSIDQAKLVPLLTKALQEAITKIETLETKVTALENK
jgi:hypothetical protein